MADLVGSHETDECARPAERAVDPRLAGLLDGLEDDIVAGRIDNVPDDRVAGSPFDTGQRRPSELVA